MIEISIILLIVVTIFPALVIGLLLQYRINKISGELVNSQKLREDLSLQLDKVDSDKQIVASERDQAIHNYIRVNSELESLQKRHEEFKNDLGRQREQFQNLANQILEEKTRKFDEQQRRGMANILEPLKERITRFEKKVEDTDKNALERHSGLKEQINMLSRQSEAISRDASNLTKALKGDFKKQGNWGEVILERVLEKSGLEKGREYFTQVTERDDDKKVQRPDVVIQLPDGKKLIIDSKVSLVSYEAAVNALDEEDAKSAKKAHQVAVKNHVDNLSLKNYHDLYKMESPDFVLMFVPIDTAFGLALEENPELYTYAFERNIVIVTPSTLLATLKTVDTMWQNDRYNKNALEIATEAGKMLDKFNLVLKDFEKMGDQLTKVQSTYDDSMKKLSTGRGNLIGKAQKVIELGAKTSKKVELLERVNKNEAI